MLFVLSLVMRTEITLHSAVFYVLLLLVLLDLLLPIPVDEFIVGHHGNEYFFEFAFEYSITEVIFL